jgi:hypothetical protein
MTQKLVFGGVGYAANFLSSLAPCACTMAARSRQKICAAALPNSRLLNHFRYILPHLSGAFLKFLGVHRSLQLLNAPKFAKITSKSTPIYYKMNPKLGFIILAICAAEKNGAVCGPDSRRSQSLRPAAMVDQKNYPNKQ